MSSESWSWLVENLKAFGSFAGLFSIAYVIYQIVHGWLERPRLTLAVRWVQMIGTYDWGHNVGVGLRIRTERRPTTVESFDLRVKSQNQELKAAILDVSYDGKADRVSFPLSIQSNGTTFLQCGFEVHGIIRDAAECTLSMRTTHESKTKKFQIGTEKGVTRFET